MKIYLKYVGIFAVIIILVLLVIKQFYEHYTDDNDDVLLDLKQEIIKIEPSISNIVFHKGEKSYTINKKHIYMCLKDENGNYYDKNVLMYVALHEVAHTFCDNIGHTSEFKNIFHKLLVKANDAGIYNMNENMIENYCEYNDKK